MNQQAIRLKMASTFYDSPHGLMNKFNISSAADQALLVTECMKIEQFRKVVGTKTYETKALAGSPKIGESVNTYIWENSNKLLGKYEGVLGCKTGITNAAGPCFAGYYENEENDIKLALILCHSKSLEARWDEIVEMINWYKRTVLAKLNKERKLRFRFEQQKRERQFV